MGSKEKKKKSKIRLRKEQNITKGRKQQEQNTRKAGPKLVAKKNYP